jgi:hypothetical protein
MMPDDFPKSIIINCNNNNLVDDNEMMETEIY